MFTPVFECETSVGRVKEGNLSPAQCAPPCSPVGPEPKCSACFTRPPADIFIPLELKRMGTVEHCAVAALAASNLVS